MLTELRPGSVSGRQTDIAVAQIPTHPSPPPPPPPRFPSSRSLGSLSVSRSELRPEQIRSSSSLSSCWEQQHTGPSHGRASTAAVPVKRPSSPQRESLCLLCVQTMRELIWAKAETLVGGVGWGALSLDPVRSNCTTLSLLIDIIWNSTSSKWICLIKHVKTVTCEKKNHFWELNLVFRCEGLESCLWSAGSVDLGLTHKTEWRWTDMFLLQLTDHFPWLKRSKGLEDGREGGGEEFKTKSLSVLNPLLSDFTSFSLFREIPADSCKQSCKWSVRGAGRGAVTLHGLTVRVYNTKPAQFRLWHAG